MKSLFMLILASATFFYFRSFGSSQDFSYKNLSFVKVGMSKSVLDKKLGLPVYEKNRIIEYRLKEKSVFRVLLNSDQKTIQSATLEFKTPKTIEELSLTEKYQLLKVEDTNDTKPTYFYITNPKNGLVWKIHLNAKVSSVAWMEPKKSANKPKQSIQELLNKFRDGKL